MRETSLVKYLICDPRVLRVMHRKIQAYSLQNKQKSRIWKTLKLNAIRSFQKKRRELGERRNQNVVNLTTDWVRQSNEIKQGRELNTNTRKQTEQA